MPLCPREELRKEGKKSRGRPHECRACDAGMVNGQCMQKNVVFPMSCTECDEGYVGEPERPVCETFREHHRDLTTLAVRSPWGAHLENVTGPCRVIHTFVHFIAPGS